MANDPQVPESDFDVLLADEQAQSANQIKQSMFVASKQDPDRAAQIVDLTKKTGVPYDLADRKFEDLKSRSDYEYLDYGGIVEKTPALAGYLKDPAKASVSKDDIDNLKNIETTYKDYGIFRSSFEALNSGLAQFNATAARIPALAYSLYTLPQNAVAKFTGDKSYEAKVPDWLLNNPVAKFYDEEAVKHQIPDLETDIIDEISSGNYGRASRGILAKAIQSAPSSLAAMGAAITTGGAGSFAVAASQAGAQAVKDGADSKADPFSQTANALYAGIFEGGIEAVGDVSILKAWEKSISKRFGKEVSKQVFTDVIKNFAYGSVIEGGGEFATSIAQDYSSFATGVNPDAMKGAGKRALEAGIVGAASGVMFESPTAFLEAHHNRVQARQAAMARDFYLSMGEGAEASKTRQRVPEFQRQFVDKITENGNVKDVYIPVEAMQTYFQKKDISLAQAAQELGISKQVDEAVQTGGDVRLPLSEWVDKVVSTEHYKGLADDIRFHEGDLTLNEAKVALEKMKSDVQDADLAATEAVKTQDDQIRQVVSYFQEQAKAAGIKKDQAEILRSIAVQAIRNGQDPIAFAKSLNLQINKGTPRVQSGETFNQFATVVPPFYSKLQQTVEQKMGNSATVEQIKGLTRELKPEELKWSGLDEFLAGKEKVSKVELVDYLRANALQIQEVTKQEFVKDQPLIDKLTEEAIALEEAEKKSKELVQKEKNKFIEAVFKKTKNTASALQAARDVAKSMRDELPLKDVAGVDATKLIEAYKKNSEAYAALQPVRTQLNALNNAPAETATKFDQYTLPGGENYREVLFTLPETVPTLTEQQNARLEELKQKRDTGNLKQDGWKELLSLTEGPNYQSSHFEERNVLAHTRLNERVDAEGKKVLFVEEIQSDWHQAGRRKGYQGDVGVKTDADLKKEYDALTEEIGKIEEEKQIFLTGLREKYTPKKITLSDFKNVRERQSLDTKYKEWTDLFGERSSFDVSKTGNVYTILKDGRTIAEYKTQKEVNANLRDLVRDFQAIGEVTSKASAEEQNKIDEFRNRLNSAQEKRLEAGKTSQAVPDAPFKKTWHEFVMKRLIREAAEKGFDKIAWTTGEQQAERYDLSKQVDQVIAKKNQAGSYRITVLKDGKIIHDSPLVKESELEEQLGKDLAAKIIAKEGHAMSEGSGYGGSHLYEGVDLKVGGEGMKGFYDKILVDFANKFGKKYGAKVGETGLSLEGVDYSVEKSDEGFYVADASGDSVSNDFPSKAEAEYALKTLNQTSDKTKVHSLEITPELKAAALNEGFSLFQGGGQDPLGRISIGENQISISLLKAANASTFFHEMGHLNLEIMQRLANDGGESAKADLKILMDWFGLKDGEAIGVNQHEQFARGFEKYLGEGVAPSKSLERIFKKFKYWIMSVYQNLRGLNVELTNEVRDVMGRMLATEAEIQSAEITMARDPLFKDPASVGMNDAQAERYIRARDEARAESEKLLLVKMMVDANKMRRQDYREKRAEIRGVVEKQVDESQVYKSIKALQENDTIKLDKSAFSKEEAKAAPKGVFAKNGGMSLDVVAPILGFSSGLELKETLLKAPNRNQIVEERVQEMMDKIYPDITRSDSDLTNAAIEALHNDSEAKLLRMELEHLASMNLPVLQDAIKRVARRVPTDAEVREEAKSIIDAKAIKDVRPSLYQRAEIKAAKQAGELLAKGDIDGAFRAKRLELLNHELYRAAVEAIDIVDKTIADGKKRFKKDLDVAKSRDTDIVNAMRAIYAEFSLAKPLDKTSDKYLELIKKYDVDTYNTMRSLVDAAVENAGDYQEVSFSAFSAMKDAVDALWELSKSVKEMEVDGKRIDRDTVKAELDARIKEFWPVSKKSGYDKAVSDRDKLAMKILNARAAGIRVEHWVDVVDVKGDGPFRKYIWNPISEGTTKYRLSKAEVLKSYEGVLREWAKGIGKNPIRSQELNYEFRDKTELMMALLHSGNESNLSKLLRGRGWGSENFEGILDTSRWDAFIARAQKEGVLTKEDYDAAQKIWDLMDSLKPDAQRAHKKMYGAYFNEITARELNTPFGKYKGGYIPAKVDLYLNSDAKIRADREAFEKNNNSFQFPTTGRGFTKSRVDSYAAPLSLELSLLGGHIDSVLRFTHIEPRVKDVSRIVNDDSFRQALASVDPSAASEMLVPWLQRSAQQRVVLPSQSGAGKLIDSFASVLRKNVAMQIMVGNFSNAAQQFTGMVVAMTRVGPRFIRDGLVSYVNSHSRTIDFMIEKSEYMRSTQGSNIYETQAAIDKIIADPDWKDNVKAFASKHTYFLQSATQNIVNVVVWTGAYNQAVEQGMADSDAIKKADSAVRMTQGTNNAEDISRVETGTATQRLFTQFAGYFNMLANLNAGELIKIQKEVGLKKGAGRAFYVYMTGLAIPAILSAAITKTLAGKGLDDDDDGYLDDLLALFFGSQTSTLTAMIPGAGQAINNVANRFNSNMYDDRLSMSPVVSTVESMLGVPAEVFYATLTDKKVNSTRVTKDALSALGVLSGLPIGPLGKPVGYVMDVSKGKIKPAKGPIARPLDFSRGLLTGKGANK